MGGGSRSPPHLRDTREDSSVWPRCGEQIIWPPPETNLEFSSRTEQESAAGGSALEASVLENRCSETASGRRIPGELGRDLLSIGNNETTEASMISSPRTFSSRQSFPTQESEDNRGNNFTGRRSESENLISPAGLQNGEFDKSSGRPINGRENGVDFPTGPPSGLNPESGGAEEIVQSTQRSEKILSDPLQGPTSAATPPEPLRSEDTPYKALQPLQKKIFKLMKIQNDNQDLSFVEKVILSQDEIFCLCNDVVRGSAKPSEGRRIIDFELLNRESMKVVGFFGSKDVMRESILQNTEFAKQREVWEEMQNDTLAPGLYVWLHSNSLFVFYWHQGLDLPEATRKDMSCNFIRYIFDLCDTVCVCLEGKNLKNALFATPPRFSKRQRTQRLQISLVKASEDSIKVTPGFLLKNLPQGGMLSKLPTKDRPRQTDMSLNVNAGGRYQLSEGHSRMALLASSTRPPKLSSSKRKIDVKVNAFPGFVDKWRAEYYLDLTDLSDGDFIMFIHCAKLKQADDYEKLVTFNERRKEEERNKIYDVDQIVAEEQERLLQCVSSFVSDFLKTRYPWEEKLMVFTSSAHRPIIATDASSELDQIQQSEHTSDVSSSASLSAASYDVKPDFNNSKDQEAAQDRLMQQESDIYSILVGENSRQRLVFPTSEFYIFYPDSGTYEGVGGQLKVYTIECSETNANMSSKFAPIRYGNYVILRSKDDQSALELKRVKLRRQDARGYQGPVLTDEKIDVDVSEGSGYRSCIMLQLLWPTSDLQEWLNVQAAQMKIPHLLKHAAWVTAICEKLDEPTMHKLDLNEEMVKQILVSDNPLELIQPVLPNPVGEFARAMWEDLEDSKRQGSESLEVPQMAIAEGVETLCTQLYSASRASFHSKISALVRRYSASLLPKKIRTQCSENCKRVEATLKTEELAFLGSQKADLSRKDGLPTGSLTVKVEGCQLIERPGGSWSRLNPTKWFQSVEDAQKVSIRFIQQEFEKQSITWKGSELAPMKEDLDQLIINPEYVFNPSCSENKEIIDLDPSSQTLLKTIFLKGGQLLVLIIEEHNDHRDLLMYLCPKLGMKLSPANVVRKIRRGFDLIAFDERSRFIALYDGSISTIKTFRFDESFRHMDWTGVDVTLGEYAIGRLMWMDFVIGKNEIVFIDEFHRVRICEVSQPAMVRSGNIHLGHGPILKACVTTQGSCLLVLRNVKSKEQVTTVGEEKLQQINIIDEGNSHSEGGPRTEMARDLSHSTQESHEQDHGFSKSLDLEEPSLMMDVYRLDDSNGILHFSSVPLDLVARSPLNLQVGVVSFGSQMHLVIHDSESPSVLTSRVIKISSASEVCQLQQITRPGEAHEREKHPVASQSGPVLDYIYQIFEKYATSPPLTSQSRDMHLRLLLKAPLEPSSSSLRSLSSSGSYMEFLSQKCLEYVNSSIDRLSRDKGKDFSNLSIHASVHDALKLKGADLLWNRDDGPLPPPTASLAVKMGDWLRRLVCLVPIQIARAENNSLKPMVDGLQLSGNVDYVDAISLANVIRFGLYEPLLDSWTGPIKVISSMGKQSSGKSYLLNHLSGSLLDVAGGRCTDGVWMTVRHGNGCLYVLLDFEGLGSFERSEQEDMLLSIFNAAISNLTIFNKKDFHLDKETEAIFERFQNGVTLVKTDAKLFKGLFYMAIKDVDSSDVDDLKKEFFNKISHICSKSQDNFLTRMYGGAVEISAMPSFNRPEFHDSIGDIGLTVEDLEASYVSGRNFLCDLKLVIAQISTKDWSPIDSKRVALRINLLRKYLKSAISCGCFFSDGMAKPLLQFDDHVEISDEPLQVEGCDFAICDTALELTAFQGSKVTGDILLSLMAIFRGSVARKGDNDEEWHAFFEKFISALVVRRKGRVVEWIASNTSDFSSDGDIQKLQLEAVALLAEVQQNLLLCSCKCERCFLRCVQGRGHPSSHSCMGDHRCVVMCTYCLEDESVLGAGPCNDAAGHDGPHDCQEKSHTCGKCCTYASISSNCNGHCSKKSGHSGDHQCNSRQHMCNQFCSLPSCKNPCVSPIDLGDHENHFCHEKFCPVQCSMSGCNRTCATPDHFHGINLGVTHHFCGSDHPCPEKCEHKGNCEVLTEVSKKTQTYQGKRATFDYELVSEQNGNRKGCCIVIPSNKDRHEGPHSHSSRLDAVHFCETRCPSCGYFCNRPMGHGGLHNTTHGNMRAVNFVSESEEIDILDRKYAWGESGVAEMCQMNCKAQGRGHTHLIHCPANEAGGTCRKLFDGAQHEMRKYGPDFNVAKDEMTHAAFWEYMRFEDPCNAEEKKQFALCNHQCRSDEHTATSGGGANSAVQNISYCTEALWHQPISKTDLVKFGTGYITEDGHHFSCDHSTNVAVNVIFIIDRSSSMEAGDIRPGMTKFSWGHNNRLGCVYEAILRFIRTRLSSVQEDVVSVILFNHGAQTVISLQEMKESLVDELLNHYASGSTTYSSGLQNAEQILLHAMKDVDLSRKSPVIVFLSDGGNNGGSDPLYHIGAMKALDPKLQLHTIMFGNDPSRKILEDMADAGDGTFEVSLDEVQLSRRFEGLAKSLRPQVASLI